MAGSSGGGAGMSAGGSGGASGAPSGGLGSPCETAEDCVAEGSWCYGQGLFIGPRFCTRYCDRFDEAAMMVPDAAAVAACEAVPGAVCQALGMSTTLLRICIPADRL